MAACHTSPLTSRARQAERLARAPRLAHRMHCKNQTIRAAPVGGSRLRAEAEGKLKRFNRALPGAAVRRKHRHGSRSERGARVAALFYSQIESAKLCGVETRGYLGEAARGEIRDPGCVALPRDLKQSRKTEARAISDVPLVTGDTRRNDVPGHSPHPTIPVVLNFAAFHGAGSSGAYGRARESGA